MNGLIACAQAMAHYGMACHVTMIAWAKANGNEEAAQIPQQMLGANKSEDAKASGGSKKAA